MNGNTFFRINGVIKFRSLFLVLFILEMLITVVVSSLPLSNGPLLAQLKSQQSAVDSLAYGPMLISIFSHNLLIATLEVIPFFGQFLFVFSIAQTSVGIAVLGSSINVNGIFLFISILLIPDTLIELPSYALASSAGIYLIYLLIKHRTLLSGRIHKVLLMYIFTALELFVAASFEAGAIIMGSSLPSPDNILYPILTWIPAAPVIYVLIKLFRRINQDEYTTGKAQEVGDITGEPPESLDLP